MKCPNCGNEIPSAAKFCSKCGTPVNWSENAGLQKDLKKPFVWKEHYTYITIGVAIVLAAIIGFMVKAFKSDDAVDQMGLYTAENAAEENGRDEYLQNEDMAKMENQDVSNPVFSAEDSSDTGARETKGNETPTESVRVEDEPEEQQGLERAFGNLPRELYSGDDFITAFRPDGVYSLMYPADYFSVGNYNESDQSYYFATSDGGVIVKFYETAAPVPGDPYESAGATYEALKGEFLEEAECPYVHQSSGVADDGYSRMVIGGPLAGDASRAAYYCTASDGMSTYVMKMEYDSVNHKGVGVEYTQTGYLLDCLYRGWSLSGSTYMLRNYEQYLADDMGMKKPGES